MTEPRSAVEMIKTAQTLDSYPRARPEMMFVACPVRLAFTTSLTGLYSVLVQYSVQRLRATARRMPMRQHQAAERSRPSCKGTYRAVASWARVSLPAESPLVLRPNPASRSRWSLGTAANATSVLQSFACSPADSLCDAAVAAPPSDF